MRVILALVLLFILAGCSANSKLSGNAQSAVPKHYHTVSADLKGLLTVNTIYLSPALFARDATQHASDLKILTSTKAKFDSILNDIAKGTLDIKVITPENKLQSAKGLVLTKEHALSDAIKTAKQLKADGVLVASVTTINERAGSRAGADEGAELGFTVSLYRALDGREVWQGSYFSKDQALSDNLFAIGDKLRDGGAVTWRSSEELIRDGIALALDDLQTKRLGAFRRQG